MSASSLPVAAHFARILPQSSRTVSGPAGDLNALLDRMNHRLYPESLPVLASWWLKTICFSGHNQIWWSELDTVIGKVLRRQSLDATATETIRHIQTWVRQAILSHHKTPHVQPLVQPPFRPDLTPDQALPYLCRVLNEWLPGEVARLITTEAGFAESEEPGIPALTIARALEQLIIREHFSPASLELLLATAWSSPKYAYPADLEILCDVVLALLGRTVASAPPILPATLLGGAFADAVDRAMLVRTQEGEELQVQLDEADAREVLQHDPVRIGSVLVTMDGRWWQSARLQSGPDTVVAYRPGGRLRIDFTAEHARIVAPWPFAETRWPGAVHLPAHIALFGREWRGRAWERSSDRTWLHLEFAGALTLSDAPGGGTSRPYRLAPASVELAWSEVERALATGVSESIDQLHREDLIPLAHALERLVNCLRRPWPSSPRDFERSLASVRYLHGSVASVYGRIPWRVLSARVRAALLKKSGEAELADLFGESFEGPPPAARTLPPRAA